MKKNEDRLLAKSFYSTEFEALLKAGVTEEMFFEPMPRKIFRFSERYYRKHGVSVTPRVIQTEFPDYKLAQDTDEPLNYYIERVRRDYLQHQIDTAGDLIADALDARDPERAREVMVEVARTSVTVDPPSTINIADVLDDYMQKWMSRAGKLEIIGLPTGFRTINLATLGWQASQLITLAGLAGAGKSTLLMLMARHAHMAGHSPFFMSFEMGEGEQLGRYIAIELGVPYNDLILGNISEEKKQYYADHKSEILNRSMFMLSTDITRQATVGGLEKALREFNPDVAFIDGVYMMRDEQTKKSGAAWDAMTNITRDLKQLAQRLEIPVVISTQALMSKTAKATKTRRKLDMYSPGYSSSFAQDSDVVIAMEFDTNRPCDRLLRVTKSRHSPTFARWVEWDWEHGRFGKELEWEEGAEFNLDDDEEDDDV